MITYSVFRLAARRTGRSVRDSVAGIRAGERKTCCAKPLPRPPGLWVLNAAPPFADAPSGQSDRATGRHRLHQTSLRAIIKTGIWLLGPRSAASVGRRGASVATPIWRAVRPHAVGTPIPGHDVSGTGWQILGGAIQSITTMMPVWQCGHSRNDWPVSASKRSR